MLLGPSLRGRACCKLILAVHCPTTMQELMASELARTGQMGEAAAGAEALAL